MDALNSMVKILVRLKYCVDCLQVVMQIHNSCSEMTEEGLAKMSVNLLNCQSAAEGRQQFPCTSKMVSCIKFQFQLPVNEM